MAALVSARLPGRVDGRHELRVSGSTTGENHEPQDVHTFMRVRRFAAEIKV
jgi:hypothetical protein